MADYEIVSGGYEHAIRQRTAELNAALQSLQYRAWKGATEVVDQTYEYARDPVSLIRDAGNFAADTVRKTAHKVRELYGAGVTAYNTILSILDTPCEDKWSVIIETALPPAGKALLVLLTPSPGEIVEEYLTPKGLLGGKCGFPSRSDRKRKVGRDGRKKLGFPSIPDTDGMIAGWLPGQHIAEDLGRFGGYRMVFTGIQIQDLVGWTWLLLDVTRDFFINWSTGMVTTRFCSRPLNCIGEVEWGPMSGERSINFYTQKQPTVLRSKGCWYAGIRTWRFPSIGGYEYVFDGTVFLRFSASPYNFGGCPDNVRVRLMVTHYGKPEETIVVYNGVITKGSGINVAASVRVQNAAMVHFSVDQWMSGCYAWYPNRFHGGIFNVYGNVRPR